jgi:ribosomal protein L2
MTKGVLSNCKVRVCIQLFRGNFDANVPRPIVRGVAISPIDHLHGGAEGCTKGGKH